MALADVLSHGCHRPPKELWDYVDPPMRINNKNLKLIKIIKFNGLYLNFLLIKLLTNF